MMAHAWAMLCLLFFCAPSSALVADCGGSTCFENEEASSRGSALLQARHSKANTQLDNSNKINKATVKHATVTAEPDMFVMHEGGKFCVNTLSQGHSTGKNHCESKCSANADCRYYSFWPGGRCRLSSECTYKLSMDGPTIYKKRPSLPDRNKILLTTPPFLPSTECYMDGGYLTATHGGSCLLTMPEGHYVQVNYTQATYTKYEFSMKMKPSISKKENIHGAFIPCKIDAHQQHGDRNAEIHQEGLLVDRNYDWDYGFHRNVADHTFLCPTNSSNGEQPKKWELIMKWTGTQYLFESLSVDGVSFSNDKGQDSGCQPRNEMDDFTPQVWASTGGTWGIKDFKVSQGDDLNSLSQLGAQDLTAGDGKGEGGFVLTGEPPVSPSAPGIDRLCFVHLGKAAGSAIGCALGIDSQTCDVDLAAAHPESAIANVIENGANKFEMWHSVHIGEDRTCGNVDSYMMGLRNPIDRIKSWFDYEKVGYEGEDPTGFFEGAQYLFDCYPSLDRLAVEALGQSIIGQTVAPDAAHMTCPQRAWAAVIGARRFGTTHNWYNHEYFYGRFVLGGRLRSPTQPLVVLRKEKLASDWNALDRLLGGSGLLGESLFTDNGTINHVSKSGEELSNEGKANLCRALCLEIQIYKTILFDARNLNGVEKAESLAELQETCPGETNEIRDCKGIPEFPLEPISSEYVDVGKLRYKCKGEACNQSKERLVRESTVSAKEALDKGRPKAAETAWNLPDKDFLSPGHVPAYAELPVACNPKEACEKTPDGEWKWTQRVPQVISGQT